MIRARSRARNAVAKPIWTPIMLGSALTGWYEAGRGITKDGSNKISAMANQVATSSVHAVQSNGAKQPAWQATGSPNGGPCIRFAGAQGLRTNGNIALQNFTACCVYKMDAAVQSNGFLWEHSDNANTEEGAWDLGQNSPGRSIIRAGYSSTVTAATPRDDVWRVVTYEFGGTPASTKVFYGLTDQGLTFSGSGSTTNTVNKPFNFGSRNDATAFFLTGYWTAFFAVNTVLGTSDRTSLISYASKL